MKTKKILIALLIFIVFLLIFYTIRPKVIIYGAPNYTSKVEAVMDFYDKYFDGDVSIWYVDKLEHSTVQKVVHPNKYISFNYPILYDGKGSKNFIIMYFVNDNLSLHRFYINAEQLYFWRIIIYLRNNGLIERSYIVKKPFGKKELYMGNN